MNATKIKNEIETTISLYQKYKDCEKKHRKDGESKLEVRKLDDFNDECTEEDNMVYQHLESLTQEEVNHILAIMYAGRDYVICLPEDKTFIPFEKHYLKFKDTDKTAAIIQIMGKTDLIEYLMEGINYYIDTYFSSNNN